MTQVYSDSSREDDAYALPDCEVFYRTLAENTEFETLDGDGEPMPAGWYWWSCFPGCMPDGDPSGPYDTEAEAIAAAQDC